MEKICPSCQTSNPAEAMFCRNCAAALPQNQPNRSNRPPQGWPNQPGQTPPPNQPGGGADFNHNFGANPHPFSAPPSPPPAGNFGGVNNQFEDRPSTRAFVALGLSVLGLIFCCGPFTGVPGAVLGWMEISAIKAGQASQKGLLLSQIALWGGIAVSVLGLIFYFLLLIAGAAGGGY